MSRQVIVKYRLDQEARRLDRVRQMASQLPHPNLESSPLCELSIDPALTGGHLPDCTLSVAYQAPRATPAGRIEPAPEPARPGLARV